MKHLVSALSVICVFVSVFVASSQSGVAQLKSDYAVVKSFESKYNDIKESIKQATTVQECAAVNANIDDLEKEFGADTVLLNNALFPDKYDNWISELRVELRLSQDKLGIIESQVSRITELEEQVRTLSGKIDSIANENNNLIASLNVMSSALAKDTKTLDSLKNIVARLRQGLRDRDAAILAMTDSLFVQYGTNVAGLPEQQKKMLVEKMQRYNVVANIKESAEQNIQFLESTELGSKDILSIVKDQHHFDSYWKGLGPKLSSLYVGRKEKDKEVSSIDSVISEWGIKADSTLWASLNNEFASKQITVEPFHNANEFVSNLSDYFDQQGGDSKASDAKKADRLNHFLNDVWNPGLGSQELPALVDDGIISKDQQTQLQTKLASWEASVKPSYTLLYAAIVIVVVLVIVAVLYGRRKKPQEPQPNPVA
ncbi:MAG: hypothetical protein WAO19_11945 [Candidatus Kryptoniota bacterium]